jgi:hypothetical protein
MQGNNYLILSNADFKGAQKFRDWSEPDIYKLEWHNLVFP